MSEYHVGHTGQIDPLGSRTVTVEKEEVALFKLSSGEIAAVENRCPHKGGKLSEGMVCGSSVHCPLHDWKIDLRSGRAAAPDEGSVKVYQAQVDKDGRIILVKNEVCPAVHP
ncbi:nitrite reductase small subunit NirD [Paenibacillus pasadenensis]|uniref:nitrite reductase small subunit NirD n=1 Tax=Paenibacillus pasadenensis TaxID=217090 RepID=UPI00203B4546|nr:nitrite reductase small subunit NirD [Paenibacillus pasadenensis]MCM3748640.1 nitrite reductase small subunit NirD [Paenibacillus pasadenensis]